MNAPLSPSGPSLRRGHGRSRPLFRALIGSAAVVALAVPGAAFAQTLRHSDPAKDVQQSSASHVGNAPANRTADIVHVTITHDGQSVRTKITLRHFARKSWSYVSQISTPSAKYLVTGHHDNGITQFLLEKGSGSATVACAGLSHRVKAARNQLVVTIPNGCLKDPSWVRVGVGYVVPIGSGDDVFADDALRTRGVSEAHLTLSRKLH